jgi:hypothetical protein
MKMKLSTKKTMKNMVISTFIRTPSFNLTSCTDVDWDRILKRNKDQDENEEEGEGEEGEDESDSDEESEEDEEGEDDGNHYTLLEV